MSKSNTSRKFNLLHSQTISCTLQTTLLLLMSSSHGGPRDNRETSAFRRLIKLELTSSVPGSFRFH